MTENEKIHSILEYICSLPENVSSIDTDEIDIDLQLSDRNIAARQLIENGDAKDCTSKDNARTGSVGLLIIQATHDAFETKKYLKADKTKSNVKLQIRFSIAGIVLMSVTIIVMILLDIF